MFLDAPAFVEGDFHGFEDAVGGEEEEEERGVAEVGEAVGDPVDAAADLGFDFLAEEVAHGEVDGLLGGVPADGTAEPDQYEEEGEEA